LVAPFESPATQALVLLHHPQPATAAQLSQLEYRPQRAAVFVQSVINHAQSVPAQVVVAEPCELPE
jgi:hypothetical protein